MSGEKQKQGETITPSDLHRKVREATKDALCPYCGKDQNFCDCNAKNLQYRRGK